MLKFRKLIKNTLGFSLIEVIISLVIVSVSFTFLIQGFINILKVSKINQETIRALVILENKLSELENKYILGTIKEEGREEIFKWGYFIEPLKELNLGKVSLNINWKNKDKINQIGLVTYLILEK